MSKTSSKPTSWLVKRICTPIRTGESTGDPVWVMMRFVKTLHFLGLSPIDFHEFRHRAVSLSQEIHDYLAKIKKSRKPPRPKTVPKKPKGNDILW